MDVQERIRETIERRGGKVQGKKSSLSERARLVERQAKAVKRKTEGKPRNWKPVPNQGGTLAVGSYMRRGGERGQLVKVKGHRRYTPMS